MRFTSERHGNGPEHFAADLNGVVFEIYPQGAGPNSANVRLGFRVRSVAESVVALLATGAKAVSPPIPGPWGLRAVVEDPDGHRVEISE